MRMDSMDIERFRKVLDSREEKLIETLGSFENMKNKVQDKLHRCPELSSEEQEWVLQALLWAERYLEHRMYSLGDAREYLKYTSKWLSEHDEEIDN